MATRTNNDVTLDHETALKVAKIIGEFAEQQLKQALKSKNAAVQEGCTRWGLEAKELAQDITKRCFTWS